MRKKYSKAQFIRIVILSVLVMLLISLISYPFVYRVINNYQNYIINRQCVIDYVHSTYGNNFEITDLSIGSFKVAVFETASTGYYGYDLFKIKDKSGNEPDFRIEIFKGKVSHDYYTHDRNKYFYENYINEYIQSYISKDQYIIDMLLFDTSSEKYDNYEEVISNSKETKNLRVVVWILIYADFVEPEKFKWIDTLYNDLNTVNYKELSLYLSFSSDKDSTRALYANKYNRISTNGNITQDTLSEFLNNKEIYSLKNSLSYTQEK